MSKLGIEQKTVKQLLEDNKANFLIPDYQRPYAWEEKECLTLWEDLFAFAFPDNDCDKFDRDNDEYFLGPIVTFTNEKKQQEVIDGQQRLTTLILLLRAFYTRFGNMQDEGSNVTRRSIEKCIWKTDELSEQPNMNFCKLSTEVATDDAKQEFSDILRTGTVTSEQKSHYAENYRFFQQKIEKFLNDFPGYFAYLPTRILNNCILLPIETESQDAALRIFSTLNDRGKPLSDSDIFKAQLYRYYEQSGRRDEFISRWKQLEELCMKIYHPASGTYMDEAFTRYMYYARAKQRIKSSTTEALRKFYERDSYALLKNDDTFENIIDLTNFWHDVSNQNTEKFSDRVLKRLFVLNYAPNGMWEYIVSVYYLVNRTQDGFLDDEAFYNFLNMITAFIWGYSLTNPGVNALRTPLFAEMINIINGVSVDFKDYKFDAIRLTNAFNNYVFTNKKVITKSMLTLIAFNDSEQPLLSLNQPFEIEHIYARNRYDHEHSLTDPRNIDSLGNKILLEKGINIRASDYRFADKIKYYTGEGITRGQYKQGTQIKELRDMAANLTDFTETHIVERNARILHSFITYLKENGLIGKTNLLKA